MCLITRHSKMDYSIVTFHVSDRNSHFCFCQFLLALNLILISHFLVFLDDGSREFDRTLQCRRRGSNGLHPNLFFRFYLSGFFQLRQGSHLSSSLFFPLRRSHLYQRSDTQPSQCTRPTSITDNAHVRKFSLSRKEQQWVLWQWLPYHLVDRRTY